MSGRLKHTYTGKIAESRSESDFKFDVFVTERYRRHDFKLFLNDSGSLATLDIPLLCIS